MTAGFPSLKRTIINHDKIKELSHNRCVRAQPVSHNHIKLDLIKWKMSFNLERFLVNLNKK